MTQSFSVPILLLAWRRPACLQQVIDSLRPLRPTRVYVACDGPSPSRTNDYHLVRETREVVDKAIDWPCKIEKYYSDTNQGCRLAVSSALNWFFSSVEEGIVLEDDCVAHPDFFRFCEVNLNRYRNDTRIWSISGSNFQHDKWRGDGSYYFSKYSHCWGWATWRRSWAEYDSDMRKLADLQDCRLTESLFPNPVERIFWLRLWSKLAIQGLPDSWAYRWTFTCLVNSGLSIIPNRNLVRNIGFDQLATHTHKPPISTDNNKGLGPIKHPRLIISDYLADEYTFSRLFAGKLMRAIFLLSSVPSALFRALINRAF